VDAEEHQRPLKATPSLVFSVVASRMMEASSLQPVQIGDDPELVALV